ncbi:MAG: glycosyltransferase family 2 protein [Gemmatimonadota bacterium]
MITFALILVALPFALALYALILYPALLMVIGPLRKPRPVPAEPEEWPMVTLSVPAYNEERAIKATLESLLAIDYPPERRQIIVVSDASTDGTDEIVRSFADRGVELLRLSVRSGKTAAENALLPLIRGDILVNTDATIRILPDALKPLVRAFGDPTVGVASGRDMSVGSLADQANAAEAGYVGYEMWVRGLETRVGSIIGASGCCYAMRRKLHDALFPSALSRDFAAALIAIERGYRAVSVDSAVCLVPRTAALQSELNRKVRTMARGLETLWYKRALMNPLKYGAYSWMLVSHKLMRWLLFLVSPFTLIGLAFLAAKFRIALVVLSLTFVGILLGIAAVRWPGGKPPRLLARLGFAVASLWAGFMAWTKALRGELNPIWEPTRRPGVSEVKAKS